MNATTITATTTTTHRPRAERVGAVHQHLDIFLGFLGMLSHLAAGDP